MSIRKRTKKKAKNGYVYEVNFQYKFYGVTEHYWKGGFETKKEAQEHEDLKKSEIKLYGKPIKIYRKTLKEVYDEFLEIGSVEFQYNTVYNTKKTLSKWHGEKAVMDIGAMYIQEIDYKILQKYFNLRSNYGKESNLDIKKALNRVFVFALKSDYLRANPLQYVKVTGVENKKEKHILTMEEYATIINTLESYNTFEFDSINMGIKIGFFTGLRLSEIMALHKEDIDFESDLIYVHRKLNYKGLRKEQIEAVFEMKSKSSKAYIPLPDELKKELVSWFKINPYERVICDEDGNYFNPDSVGNRLRSITKKLNIPFHFHLLRHTYTTYLVNAQVDVKVAQELLRHASFNTTMSVYAHVNDDKKKAVVNSVFGENLAKMDKKINTLS